MDQRPSIVSPDNSPLSTQTEIFIQAATSANTRKAYQQDIRHFIQWGGFLPSSVDQIIAYLEYYAEKLNARTLMRRLTAIKHWHLYQGFSDPTAHSAVRKMLRGIQNIYGQPKNRALPLTPTILKKMVDLLNSSTRLIDIRNSALLQIGFFGAFRRSELVAIQWQHLHFVPEGLKILIPRSKTDQKGEGQICAIPYGRQGLCPVTALKNWCTAGSIETNYIFRHVSKKQIVSHRSISAHRLNILLKSIAHRCNLPNADAYSGHSLRRGFATAASHKGLDLRAIMRHGRWQHESTVLDYIAEGKLFDDNAAAAILEENESY